MRFFLPALLERLEKRNIPAWTLLSWCALMLVFFYPFALSGELNVVVKQGLFVFGGLISIGYIVLVYLCEPLRIPSLRIFLALLAVCFVSVLSTIFSDNPFDALTGLAFELDTFAFVLSFASIAVASSLVFKWQVVPYDLGSTSVHLLGITLLVPVVLLHIKGTPLDGFVYVQNGSLQMLAVLLLCSCAYYFDATSGASGYKKVFFLTYAAAAAYVCAVTPFFILLIFGAFLCLFIAVVLASHKERLRWPFLTLLATVFFLMLSFYSFSLSNREVNKQYFQETVYISRALMFTFQYDTPSPFLGNGPHSFTQFWDMYRSGLSNNDPLWTKKYEAPYIYDEPKYAFGLIPTWVISTGVLGLIAWSFLLIVIFHRGIIHLRRYAFAKPSHVLGVVVLFSLLYFMIVVVPPVQFCALAALLLGALMARTNDGITIAYPVALHWILRAVVMVILCIVFLASAFWMHTVVSSSVLFQKSVDLWLHDPESTSGYELEYTQKLVEKRQRPEYYRALSQMQLASASKLLMGTTTPETGEAEAVRTLLSQSVINGSKAAELNLKDYRNWVVLGDLHTFLFMFGANDAYELARDYYGKASALTPANPVPAFGLARLKRMQGFQKEALGDVQRALEFKPQWEEAQQLQKTLEEEVKQMELNSLQAAQSQEQTPEQVSEDEIAPPL